MTNDELLDSDLLLYGMTYRWAKTGERIDPTSIIMGVAPKRPSHGLSPLQSAAWAIEKAGDVPGEKP